jgi:hypothetical protein
MESHDQRINKISAKLKQSGHYEEFEELIAKRGKARSRIMVDHARYERYFSSAVSKSINTYIFSYGFDPHISDERNHSGKEIIQILKDDIAKFEKLLSTIEFIQKVNFEAEQLNKWNKSKSKMFGLF